MYGSALTFPLKPGFCGRVYQFYKSRQIEHIKTSANSSVKQAHVGTTTHISHTLYAIAGNAPVYVSACLFFLCLCLCLSLSVCFCRSLLLLFEYIPSWVAHSLIRFFMSIYINLCLHPSSLYRVVVDKEGRRAVALQLRAWPHPILPPIKSGLHWQIRLGTSN